MGDPLGGIGIGSMRLPPLERNKSTLAVPEDDDSSIPPDRSNRFDLVVEHRHVLSSRSVVITAVRTETWCRITCSVGLELEERTLSGGLRKRRALIAIWKNYRSGCGNRVEHEGMSVLTRLHIPRRRITLFRA